MVKFFPSVFLLMYVIYSVYSYTILSVYYHKLNIIIIHIAIKEVHISVHLYALVTISFTDHTHSNWFDVT
jgi:hypothetical protein